VTWSTSGNWTTSHLFPFPGLLLRVPWPRYDRRRLVVALLALVLK
jgi:hypothetical protein